MTEGVGFDLGFERSFSFKATSIRERFQDLHGLHIYNCIYYTSIYFHKKILKLILSKQLVSFLSFSLIHLRFDLVNQGKCLHGIKVQCGDNQPKESILGLGVGAGGVGY